MSLDFYFQQGTGHSHCKICNKLIVKGTNCIYATDGWRASGHCHINKRACDKAKEEQNV